MRRPRQERPPSAAACERPRPRWREASPTSRSPASEPASTWWPSRRIPRSPRYARSAAWRSFDSAHAEYFFGRERLVADLVARLVGSTLIAVVGPSGSGKSSVLRAGLLPALADGVLPGSERWRQVVMRPGEHPLAELGRALARVASGEGEPDGDDPLAAVAGLARTGRALGPGRRSARGDLHRLPRRGRARRLRRRARGPRRRRRSARGGGAWDSG